MQVTTQPTAGTAKPGPLCRHGIIAPGERKGIGLTTRADIEAALAEIAPRYGVSRAFLFGSRARGDCSARSDVDLVVELSRPLGFKRAELHGALEEALGEKVDLVFGCSQLYGPVRREFDRDKVVVYAS